MSGVEVEYSEENFRILKEKRRRAKELMEILEKFGLQSITYGSIARGDVNVKSDVDIFIPQQVPSFKIELALEGFDFVEKRIVQATPNYAIKGEFVIDELTTISFPLVKMKERELDFYRFGGCISYGELLKDLRVPGVDKRLFLIVPNAKGHKEIPLSEIHPSVVAKILGVSIDIVLERMRILSRRREIGRTGIYICEKIPIEESFESALRELISKNPAIRRRILD
ncbi:MAG: nucleotidyltransferase domain-containing protein [Archaeoglobaceae archaeon]|nr:nucleotidyltransferase domain-containing protein [Archaeoglobaceae archaeon]MDW8128044.1 nucleotidyltransferase domain-containing protein [Archaeoglobaceae archaeon]